MFDLEKAVEEWKLDLRRTESVSRENSLELEEHLRETIGDLVGNGLTQLEAFWVAETRLGASSSLGDEFSKVNGNSVWRGRITWMLFGYLGVSAFASAVSGITRAAGTFSSLVGLGGASAAVVAIMIAFASWAIFLAVLYHLSSRRDARLRVHQISVGLLAVLCATMVIGRGIAALGAIFHTRVVEVSEFGEYALWSSIGGTVVGFCVVVGCAGMILAIRDKSVETPSIIE